MRTRKESFWWSGTRKMQQLKLVRGAIGSERRSRKNHLHLCGNGHKVRTIWGNFIAFTPNKSLTERYYTAKLAPRKQPGNGYHMNFLESKLNLDCTQQNE